jgi:hypothetical protein
MPYDIVYIYFAIKRLNIIMHKVKQFLITTGHSFKLYSETDFSFYVHII